MIRTLVSIAALAGTTLLPAAAQTLAYTGATIWTGTDAGTIEDGTIIVRNGEIEAIGPSGRVRIPTDATEIDATGKWITPGVIAPFSRIGLVEVNAEDDTNDTSAGQANFTVALNAAKGFNPAASTIDVTRIEGVTQVVVAPRASGSLFAGQGLIADTSGGAESVTEDQAFVFMEMGERGADLAGGSRAAAWRFLQGAVFDARTYPGRYMSHDLGDSLNRADAESFIPVVRGQKPLVIAAHRASDLREIITFKERNSRINLIVVGADEGWMVADDLAAAGIPVIVDPFQNLPASFEQLGATSHNAARLIEAGVVTAFAHLDDDGHQARLVLQSAGNAVANGVDHDDALAAITRVPAEIFGLEDVGVLADGAAADLVVWDGDPLEVMTSPDAIYIGGVSQSLQSRQTRLRDRYLSLEAGERPMAYRR